jgi:hypothetical protein
MKRRQVLQTMGAGSVLDAFGPLSGCASTGSSTGPKVVVVGARFGGAARAKYLRMWSDYGVNVTLMSPDVTWEAHVLGSHPILQHHFNQNARHSRANRSLINVTELYGF